MPRTDQQHPIPADTVVKITKEICVKFIEVGRLTPASFDRTFREIYRTIEDTVTADD